MEIRTINRTIGYGILVFLIGFFLGIHLLKYLQLLMSVGFLMTAIGIFYFFKETNLKEQFQKDHDEDFLTYFWNVIFFKLQTFMLFVWMIVMNLTLILDGLQ